ALHRDHGVLRVLHGLALGDLADEALALASRGHDGGRGARALGVGNDHGLAILHDGDAAVRRSEIDPDDATHEPFGASALAARRPLQVLRYRRGRGAVHSFRWELTRKAFSIQDFGDPVPWTRRPWRGEGARR